MSALACGKRVAELHIHRIATLVLGALDSGSDIGCTPSCLRALDVGWLSNGRDDVEHLRKHVATKAPRGFTGSYRYGVISRVNAFGFPSF